VESWESKFDSTYYTVETALLLLGCRVVGFERLKMDRTLSPLHDFGVKNGIRFFLVPTKLMFFLLLCHHDVSRLF
jgi:hypothetical protein